MSDRIQVLRLITLGVIWAAFLTLLVASGPDPRDVVARIRASGLPPRTASAPTSAGKTPGPLNGALFRSFPEVGIHLLARLRSWWTADPASAAATLIDGWPVTPGFVPAGYPVLESGDTFRVVLDPGHGGRAERTGPVTGDHWDPDSRQFLLPFNYGADVKNLTEHRWTLETARKVERLLRLTRTDRGFREFVKVLARHLPPQPIKHVRIQVDMTRRTSFQDEPNLEDPNLNQKYRLFDSPTFRWVEAAPATGSQTAPSSPPGLSEVSPSAPKGLEKAQAAPPAILAASPASGPARNSTAAPPANPAASLASSPGAPPASPAILPLARAKGIAVGGAIGEGTILAMTPAPVGLPPASVPRVLTLATDTPIGLGRISRINRLGPDLVVCLHNNADSSPMTRGFSSVVVPHISYFTRVQQVLGLLDAPTDPKQLRLNKRKTQLIEGILVRTFAAPVRQTVNKTISDTFTYFTGVRAFTRKFIGLRHRMVTWAGNLRSAWLSGVLFLLRENSLNEYYRRAGGPEGVGGDNYFASQELLRHVRLGLWRDYLASPTAWAEQLKGRKPNASGTFTPDQVVGPLGAPFVADWAVPMLADSVTAYLELGFATNAADRQMLIARQDTIAESLAVGIYALLAGMRAEARRDIPSPRGIPLNLEKYAQSTPLPGFLQVALWPVFGALEPRRSAVPGARGSLPPSWGSDPRVPMGSPGKTALPHLGGAM